jgi:ubiquinone biosynthesis protein UbiJ
MATQSPFSLLEGFLQNLNLPLTPPDWMVQETHRRVVLLLNHVLMQEPAATERLARQKGQVVLVCWRNFTFKVVVTPPGLLDLADAIAPAHLTLTLTQDSPFEVAQALMQGDKPAIRIEGDVQLAADINWLVDHLRWDLEEDLARIVGDAPAHTLVQTARSMAQALAQFVGKAPTPGASA